MSGFLRIIPIILSANTDDTLDDTIDKRCINLLLLSTARMHLYLALLSHRDYFRRSNSSLSGFSVPQGLFQPTGFIPPLLFCSTRIISADQMHLYLALLFHKDYFGRPDASLSRSFVPQGCFPPPGCISIFLLCPTGIISTGQIHLYLAFLFHRDYFGRPDSSLPCSFAPQGCFPPPGCISIFLLCPTGIILPQPDASLSSSFAPQGLFPPVKFISIWLFCSTGIISADRIHPSPALLLHRDYFSSTSNLRSQPDTHFAADMFPYKKTSLFRCRASNPNFRKSPESMFFYLSYATLDALRKQSSHGTLCSVCA